MFDIGWDKVEGLGYMMERRLVMRHPLNEAYTDLDELQSGSTIPDKAYLEAYPNIKLARLLGNDLLNAKNWNKHKYTGSYYFEIKMFIDCREFRKEPVMGMLRISDHKVNPLTFASKNRHVIGKNGKKYSFGISVVLPRLRKPLGREESMDIEAHVFQYISADMSDTAIYKLKDMLEKYVKGLAVANVGFDHEINPIEYKEVTNGKNLFRFTKEQEDTFWQNRGVKSVSPAADMVMPMKTNKPPAAKRGRKPSEPEKNLAYYMDKLGMEPVVMVYHDNAGKRGPKTIDYNGSTWQAASLGGFVRPKVMRRNSFLMLRNGLFVWKTPEGEVFDAALADSTGKLTRVPL